MSVKNILKMALKDGVIDSEEVDVALDEAKTKKNNDALVQAYNTEKFESPGAEAKLRDALLGRNVDPKRLKPAPALTA